MIETTETLIPGLLLVEPRVHTDTRGYFCESYNLKRFTESGINNAFVQDNESRSSRNVVRGLHYQLAPYAQTKLLRVIDGVILDVVVDLRSGSSAFAKWYAIELSADNHRQLLIPKGCAHGFRVISKNATILYKCDEYYYPAAERCIRFCDPKLQIDWGLPAEAAIVSEKDRNAPFFDEAEMNF